jgi:polyisoprenoid-binding protein YceI
VEEQLASLDLPNDVIGETPDVSGSITFNADGEVQSDQSLITVNLQTLKTDSDRRDGYLKENSLETNRFPTAQIVVTDTPGLTWPFPAEGEATFQIVGDMTVRDQTRAITWDATARFEGDSITGQARTGFTFNDFDMDKPSVFIVLSVEDNIRVELDFVAGVVN